MAKPKSTVRVGTRMVNGRPVVVTTKKGSGLLDKALKAIKR